MVGDKQRFALWEETDLTDREAANNSMQLIGEKGRFTSR